MTEQDRKSETKELQVLTDQRARDRTTRWNDVYTRIREAVRARAHREGLKGAEARMGLKRLGEELAAAIGRDKPFDVAIIHRIGTGERALDADVAEAMSAVAHQYGIEVDPAWIVFGSASAVPAPPVKE